MNDPAGTGARDYEDIIRLPHHVSAIHPPMSRENRAAQFSPFAALTGYGDAVRETARLTDQKPELDDSRKEELGLRLQFLARHLPEHPTVTVSYFRPDERKEGGSYETVTAVVKKIDPVGKFLILRDGTRIPLDDLLELDGELFKDYE